MMMWRALKPGTILAALRPAKKTDTSKKRAVKNTPNPQPNPAH